MRILSWYLTKWNKSSPKVSRRGTGEEYVASELDRKKNTLMCRH